MDDRRWVNVWWAPDRGAALERVHLQRDEHATAAFPGDRKWCVLVERRDPRDLLRLEVLSCHCGDLAHEEVIGDEDQEQLAAAGDDPTVLARYVVAEWRDDLAIGNVRIRRGHWRYRLVDPCEECDGDGIVVYRDVREPCSTCDGVGAALVLMEDTPALFWHDDPDGHTWVHGEVLRADDPNVWRPTPAAPLTPTS